jgi:hypothetical protein
MLPPFAIPYLIGIVSAPLVAKIAQPIARSAVKATIQFGLQARKLAAEAAEDLQDLAAEASAEMTVAEIGKTSGSSVAGSKKR